MLTTFMFVNYSCMYIGIYMYVHNILTTTKKETRRLCRKGSLFSFWSIIERERGYHYYGTW